MKKYITLSLLLCVATLTYSQSATTTYGLTTGLSIPTGKFSQAQAGTFDHWNNTAGYAKTGYNVTLNATHYFFKHFGAGAVLTYSDHGGFSGKDAKNLGDSYTDAFAVDNSTVSTSGRYRSLNLLVGPSYKFFFGRFALDVNAMAGIIKSISTPEMTVQLEDQENATFSQKSSTASAFGWQAGANLTYILRSRVSLVFHGSYFQSPGVTIENENRPNKAGRLVTNQAMSWVNVNAGVVFRLN